jgi:hypothetical protein
MAEPRLDPDGGVEAAYRRGDTIQKRRQLMAGVWADYCCGASPDSNVVEMPKRDGLKAA